LYNVQIVLIRLAKRFVSQYGTSTCGTYTINS